MISKELANVLVCPKCRGKVWIDEDTLICDKCRLVYIVKDNIPLMLIDEATPLKDKNEN